MSPPAVPAPPGDPPADAGAPRTVPATRGAALPPGGGLEALRSTGRALDHRRAEALVARGALELEGQLTWGSNATLLARVTDGDERAHVIYKPRRGEQPLWDFPAGTLCRREVAAYLVSEALGWGLVPPTVLRRGPLGPGMVQLFVAHDPDAHFLTLAAPDPAFVARVVAFDVAINNADRKSGHVLVSDDGRLWAIDHGIAFHVEPKLRTVIWDLAGRPLPAAVGADLARLAEALADDDAPVARALAPLLAPAERAALARRARRLAEAEAYPAPTPDRRHVPWPPV